MSTTKRNKTFYMHEKDADSLITNELVKFRIKI